MASEKSPAFGSCLAVASLNKAGRENWVHYDSVARCGNCRTEFGLLTQKHHCRACGNIYCWKCCNKEIEYTPASRAEEEGYVEKKKRVCEQCFTCIAGTRKREAEAKAKAGIAGNHGAVAVV